MKFDPERYLKSTLPDPVQHMFGYGRRICPARHLALDSIWITMVTLLTAFSMAKDVGEDGCEVEPVECYPNGLVSHPQPYKCCFIPRSEKITWLIK
ncbi:hypothetical protein PM082_016472 [Marasmius tenuissimus]|nr:hypothetical protein PM082_016472 [Marasmius tenuissimus]